MLKNLFFTVLVIVSFQNISCSSNDDKASLINTAHLDHLYEEVVVNYDTLGIIHIYAEYPDYHWVDDVDEGTACVDDAARAMVFYLNHYKLTSEQASLNKTKKILNFLFYMQAENGFFYNFVWKDNSINKEFRTSVAEPNWWSWRALWALAEADNFFSNDEQLRTKINSHINKLIEAAKSNFSMEEKYSDFSGFNLPVWLPYETASDQAAIMLKGLSTYYNSVKDSTLLPMISKLAKGILGMQAGNQETFPYYAFLSWQNTWHAWGNSQADALLAAGKILNDSSIIKSALNEIKYFYPYLMKENYFSSFSIQKNGGKIEILQSEKYPQIAYGFRPMIYASLAAYKITKDTSYVELAGKIASWFSGNNVSSIQMYDPATGRCFDGIVNENKVNKNSGAESTIEALLALLEIEKDPATKKIMHEKAKIFFEDAATE